MDNVSKILDICTGCSACAQTCPVNAIDFVENKEGFLEPKINSRCINCGICIKKCPLIKKKFKINQNLNIAYAIQNKNEIIRKNSSSGGVFFELASYFINCGGVVFGATINKEGYVYHKQIDNINDIKMLMGSKYVQSDMSDCFKKCEDLLNQQKLVLFTGTPCQISGLKAYLKSDYDNLYTQDIICHGVPSPKIWRYYLEYVTKDNINNLSINFRQKSKGWSNFSLYIKNENEIIINESMQSNLYLKIFLKDLILRNSCYECRFKKNNRDSDFILADFWGAELICKKLKKDDKGTSLLILRSNKAKNIFNQIKDNFNYEGVDFEIAINYNKAFSYSVTKPKNREEIFKKIEGSKLLVLLNKLTKEPLNKKAYCFFRKKASNLKKSLCRGEK